MREEKEKAHRLAAYSDAVFAVIVTIMVWNSGARSADILGPLAFMAHGHQLCGKLPVHRNYLDKPPLPDAVGRSDDLRLIWINFVHLFMISLLPFATAWVARTRLASSPVVFYAGLFVCIDIAYNVFERQVFAGAAADQVSERTRRIARRRSLVVLAIFTAAMLIAFVAPRVGFGLICGALILHLRPDVSGSRP